MSETASSFLTSDKQLSETAGFQALYDKYSTVASDETIDKVKAGLEKKNHAVTIAANKEEALKALIALIPSGVSLHNTSSTTLHQIGMVEYLKSTDKYNNLHAKIFAETDPAKQNEARRIATGADYALTSVDAVTEDGEFALADASGTRIGVFYAARSVIVVIGANKIVKDLSAAKARIHEYCYALESARVRAAYGWAASSISNELFVHTNALMPAKFHFIIVKESLGF